MQKQYWFKAKKYGWGWTPATREGWIVTLVAIVGVIGTVFYYQKMFPPEKLYFYLIPAIIGWIIILLVICYNTGEPPRWRWGN